MSHTTSHTTGGSNVRVGSSKTVHNALATVHRRGEQIAEGEWAVERIAVPTCSVATEGRDLRYTDDAVTCKTCAKRVAGRAV